MKIGGLTQFVFCKLKAIEAYRGH